MSDLRELLDDLERLAYDQGVYGDNSIQSQSELQVKIDAVKEAILNAVTPAADRLAELVDISEELIGAIRFAKWQHVKEVAAKLENALAALKEGGRSDE